MEMNRRADVSTAVRDEYAGIVYVVDDDDAMRDAISSLIRSLGFATRTFSRGRDFLESDRPEKPSCLILDVRLLGSSGFAVQNEMRNLKIEMPVIFMTAHGDVAMSVKAMKAGAFDFLAKPFNEQEIADAITEAIRIDRQRLRAQRFLSGMRSRLLSLTPRQRDVMMLMVEGLVTKQIAVRLNISEITVKLHRREVMSKMEAHSLGDLIIKVFQLGLCEPWHKSVMEFQNCNPR
jgi:FixJ family two-component response regulator